VKNKEIEEEGSYLPLNIKSPEAERLARVLAEKTGETITETVTKALRERLPENRDGRPCPASRKSSWRLPSGARSCATATPGRLRKFLAMTTEECPADGS